MTLTAFAPASIGNVSLGFDVLGAAITPIDGQRLGDTVSIAGADTAGVSLEVTGAFAHALPSDSRDNIVIQCAEFFHQALLSQDASRTVENLRLVLHKNLPIGSGLGSSASSIVAAFTALNAFYHEPFDDQALLRMMGELEGKISGQVHYDNVAPSFLGGMSLMVEQTQTIAVTLPTPEQWYWVVCYSGLTVSTAEARKILPTRIPLGDTIAFGRQLGVFVHALHSHDSALAASVISDVIAEPTRKTLLPHFDTCRSHALARGALAFGISGSGPTVFALCQDLASAESVAAMLTQDYQQNERGFCHVCRIDAKGATVTHTGS